MQVGALFRGLRRRLRSPPPDGVFDGRRTERYIIIAAVDETAPAAVRSRAGAAAVRLALGSFLNSRRGQ